MNRVLAYHLQVPFAYQLRGTFYIYGYQRSGLLACRPSSGGHARLQWSR